MSLFPIGSARGSICGSASGSSSADEGGEEENEFNLWRFLSNDTNGVDTASEYLNYLWEGDAGGCLRDEQCATAVLGPAAQGAAGARGTWALLGRNATTYGFARTGTPIVVDSTFGPGITTGLRAQGYNVRSVAEIFGRDPKDPAIRALAERIGARVLTLDRGRDGGMGLGRSAIQADQRIANSPAQLARFLRSQGVEIAQ